MMFLSSVPFGNSSYSELLLGLGESQQPRSRRQCLSAIAPIRSKRVPAKQGCPKASSVPFGNSSYSE